MTHEYFAARGAAHALQMSDKGIEVQLIVSTSLRRSIVDVLVEGDGQ